MFHANDNPTRSPDGGEAPNLNHLLVTPRQIAAMAGPELPIRPAIPGVDDVPVTWEEITHREPRLLALEAAVLADREAGREREWYGDGTKGQLCELVGWGARTDDPLLRSEAAY